MSNRIFLISDTHFGHKKVIQFESEYRPFDTLEEHDEELIYRWNNTVRKRDTVWHLGDVLFGAASFNILPRLNGIKKLILGNHDSYPSARYLEHFNSLNSCAMVRGYLLTHIPLHPSQFRKAKGNIHGHLHHGVINDPDYINVCVEHTNLAPILIDKIEEGNEEKL